MEGLILTGSILLFSIVFISFGIRIVPQSDIFIVERLGKYNSVLHGGFHVIIPLFDKVRNKVTVREQMINIPKQSVITKDNVNISIDGIVFYKIENAKDATYNVVSFISAISNLATTTLRAEIGAMDLDESLSNREKLNIKLQEDLGKASINWGIHITRVEISEISVPIEIQKSMNKQMMAEREKRAIELNARAHKEKVILEAEAAKQQKVLEAEAIERMADAKKYEELTIAQGQQEAMQSINEEMSKNINASEFLLAKDRIEAFKQLASSESIDKMILPYDVTQLIGSMSVIGDSFFKGVSNGHSNI